MVAKYGLIAEDQSDIDVIKKLAKKIVGRNISASQFVGKGCGPIKTKAAKWCKAFEAKGCTQILLIHDRDRHNADALRKQLEEAIAHAPQLTKVVIVPCEELEAWLLADATAIKVALGMRKAIKEEFHPETINSPKEYLGGSVWKVSEKRITYVNSLHNPLIADHIEIAKISKKCPSFSAFETFFKPPTQKKISSSRSR